MNMDEGVQEFKLRLLERAGRWQDAAGLASRLATSHPDESRWFIAWPLPNAEAIRSKPPQKSSRTQQASTPKTPHSVQPRLLCRPGEVTSPPPKLHVRRAIELDHDLEKLAHQDPDLEPLRQAHLID